MINIHRHPSFSFLTACCKQMWIGMNVCLKCADAFSCVVVNLLYTNKLKVWKSKHKKHSIHCAKKYWKNTLCRNDWIIMRWSDSDGMLWIFIWFMKYATGFTPCYTHVYPPLDDFSLVSSPCFCHSVYYLKWFCDKILASVEDIFI